MANNKEYQKEHKAILQKLKGAALNNLPFRGPLVTLATEIPSTSSIVECTRGNWRAILKFQKKEWFDNALNSYATHIEAIKSTEDGEDQDDDELRLLSQEEELVACLLEVQGLDSTNPDAIRSFRLPKEWEILFGKTVVFSPACKNFGEGAEKIHDFLLKFTVSG